MKNNQWVRSLISLVLIVILLVVGTYFLNIYRVKVQFFEISPVYLSLLYLLFFALIGIILGGEQFVINYYKEGFWKLNKARLLILGLPALFFSLSYVWWYLGLFDARIINFMLQSEGILIVSGLIFGYSIITSFEKY